MTVIFGGDATSFEQIEAADIFSIGTVDNLSLFIDEMAHPLQPVRLSGDELHGEDPYYVLYVTPRQWNDWYTSTSGKDWNQMMVRAVNRAKVLTIRCSKVNVRCGGISRFVSMRVCRSVSIRVQRFWYQRIT